MSLAAALAARRGYFALSLVVVLLDQATKILAHAYLRGRGAVTLIPGCFDLSYSRNPGGLFGYFSDWADPWRSLLLTLLPVAAVVLIAGLLAKGQETDRWTFCGLALILGGAVGNLIDRLLRGEVVDFFDVYAPPSGAADWLASRFGTAHWPTFNIADSSIVVGACLLLVSMLLPQRERRSAEMPRPSAPAEGQGPR